MPTVQYLYVYLHLYLQAKTKQSPNSYRVAKYVLDADISKCFDKIDHAALLKKIGYKGKVRRQIKAWLKSGVIDNNTFLETEEGTPQGGVVSPLLANIALHGLENHLNEFAKTIDMKKPDGHSQQGWLNKVKSLSFIRYADDLVLIHKDKKVVLDGKKIIEEWLLEIGLELKPSKTRIAHTLLPEESEDGKAGFNFLGFNIRLYKAGKYTCKRGTTGKPLGFRTLITPTKEAYKKHQKKLRETIKNKKIEGQAELIGKLNPIIRGWMNYYKTSDISTVGGHSKQDNDLYNKLRSWSRRKCKANWKRAYAKYWNYVIIKDRKVKRSRSETGAINKSPILPKKSIPPMRWQTNGKSMGFRRLKWLLLKERNHHRNGTNKNESKVCR